MSTTKIYDTIPLRETLLGPAFESLVSGLSPDNEVFSPWDETQTGSRKWMVYEVTIGGKSGAGKSTLINTLLRQDIFQRDDVRACTTEAQSVFLRAFEHRNIEFGILLTDLPGVADGTSRSSKYFRLYEDWFQASQAFLYLVQMNDRAFESDEKALINRDSDRLWVGLSQVDKAPPWMEWNDDRCRPSQSQAENIKEKVSETSASLCVSRDRIIPFAAKPNGAPASYNIDSVFRSIASDLAVRAYD